MIYSQNEKSFICGSIAASDEIIAAQKELEERGFEVEIPFGCKKYIENGYVHVAEEERAGDKKEHDLIRRYYELMKEYDIVLVVNVEKNGVQNYIGGNTFLEMAFAHVLDKPLYVLNPLPDLPYRSELEAMNHTVLDRDLSKIK